MAEALIGALHGRALRALAGALDVHVQGLQQGARLCRRRGLLSNRLARKLLVIDHAFALSRHVTEQSVSQFLAELEGELTTSMEEPSDVNLMPSTLSADAVEFVPNESICAEGACVEGACDEGTCDRVPSECGVAMECEEVSAHGDQLAALTGDQVVLTKLSPAFTAKIIDGCKQVRGMYHAEALGDFRGILAVRGLDVEERLKQVQDTYRHVMVRTVMKTIDDTCSSVGAKFDQASLDQARALVEDLALDTVQLWARDARPVDASEGRACDGVRPVVQGPGPSHHLISNPGFGKGKRRSKRSK